MLAAFDTVRIFIGRIKARLGQKCAVPAPVLVSEIPDKPKLNWVYQPPAHGVSYDQWRASMAEMPDCDDARQIFQKHQRQRVE